MSARRRPIFKDESECDGYGTMRCECGGDLCVCGADGEDCFGCEKCEGREGDDGFDFDSPREESGVPRGEPT